MFFVSRFDIHIGISQMIYRSSVYIAALPGNVTRARPPSYLYLRIRKSRDFSCVCVYACAVCNKCIVCDMCVCVCAPNDSPPAASFICISVSMSTVCMGFGGNFVGRTNSSRDWLFKCWRISVGDWVVVDVVVTNVRGGRRRTESPTPYGLPSINKTTATERHIDFRVYILAADW